MTKKYEVALMENVGKAIGPSALVRGNVLKVKTSLTKTAVTFTALDTDSVIASLQSFSTYGRGTYNVMATGFRYDVTDPSVDPVKKVMAFIKAVMERINRVERWVTTTGMVVFKKRHGGAFHVITVQRGNTGTDGKLGAWLSVRSRDEASNRKQTNLRSMYSNDNVKNPTVLRRVLGCSTTVMSMLINDRITRVRAESSHYVTVYVE